MRRPDRILLMCAARKPSQQLRSEKSKKKRKKKGDKQAAKIRFSIKSNKTTTDPSPSLI
jgi:hypothetical protein